MVQRGMVSMARAQGGPAKDSLQASDSRRVSRSHPSFWTNSLLYDTHSCSWVLSLATMAAIEENSLSPILRLASQEWTVISSFLDSNDILRMLSVGNAALARILRQGYRFFNATWNSSRYIDFSEVLTASNQLETICAFSFSSPFGLLSWSLLTPTLTLPKSLTELNLRFLGSIDLILGSGASELVSDRFPLLKSLQLVSESHDSRHYATPLRLDSLPSSLRSLTLKSTLCFHVLSGDHLMALPPNLESLSIIIASEHPLANVPLVGLPPRLTSLKLSYYNWRFDISFALLPSTLRYFQFSSSPNSNLQWSDNLPTYLPNLHTLIYVPSRLPIATAAKWFPCSLTHLNVALVTEGCDDIQSALQAVSPALVRFSLPGELEIGKLISSAAVSLPRLSALRVGTYAPSYIQPSVKKLVAQEVLCALPQGLEELTLLSKFGGNSLLQLKYPTTLRVFHGPVDTFIHLEHIAAFPSSLEEFSGTIDSIPLKALFRRMVLGELPHLRTVQAFGTIAYEIDELPPQLAHFTFQILESSFRSPIDPRVLSSLKQSKLKTLDFGIPGKELGLTAYLALLELLNNLPETLTTLNVHCLRGLASDWPITFPSKLKSLTWSAIDDELPLVDPQPCHLYLPPSLTYITLRGCGKLSAALTPPYLSHYKVYSPIATQLVDQYFLSRSPPHAGQTLHWNKPTLVETL